jgi:hypothetical protein
MNNLKSVTNLPFAESAEGLNLIVNDSGAAKQIAASAVGAQADWNEVDETKPSFIQNKPTKLGGYNRELVYEKHFAAEDDVRQALEFLADMSSYFVDGVEMCAEVEYYAWNNDQNYPLADHFCMSKLTQYDKFMNVYGNLGQIVNCDMIKLEFWGGDPMEFSNDNGDSCGLYPYAMLGLLNRLGIDEAAGGLVSVDNGGILMLMEAGCPLKSIKLYKITY